MTNKEILEPQKNKFDSLTKVVLLLFALFNLTFIFHSGVSQFANVESGWFTTLAFSISIVTLSLTIETMIWGTFVKRLKILDWFFVAGTISIGLMMISCWGASQTYDAGLIWGIVSMVIGIVFAILNKNHLFKKNEKHVVVIN